MTDCTATPVYRITIRCGCGMEHASIEAWRNCPMALSPAPNQSWWRVVVDGESLNDKQEG